MIVSKPEDMNRAFAEAYNSGKIQLFLDLYESEAVLVPQPNQQAVGLEQIQSALQSLLSLGGEMQSENQYCLQHGNIALLRAKWRLSTVDAEGKPLIVEGNSAEVVRQQTDGTWKYIIDHAFGAD
jgi:ketosteroid isomerase-like protein